jgi:hypothetical protein
MRRATEMEWIRVAICGATLSHSSCDKDDQPLGGGGPECVDLDFFLRLEDGGLPDDVLRYLESTDIYDAGLNAAGCRPGHRCLGFACDERCDPALCRSHEDCTSATGTCRFVECSERVACAPGFICESRSNRCFPANGDCRSGNVCPQFGGDLLNAVATVSCMADGLCAVTPKAGPPPFFNVAEQIAVSIPTRGTRLSAPAQPEFEWRSFPGSASLLIVTNRWPVDGSILASAAIWGAAVASGTDHVGWSAGKPIERGRWLDAAPQALTAGSYFFVVQAVINGSLEAASPVVPFVVGENTPWKQPGDGCLQSGLPGDCENPSQILSCIDGSCRKVCASDVECGDMGPCGEPTGFGYRLCSP